MTKQDSLFNHKFKQIRMLQQLLEEQFGFKSFGKGQEEVITKITNRESAIAIFPTGSGKSLCYQLPALTLPNLTLVVSPLLALILLV